MDSEIFEKLPPTKLFFRCAIPSMITMAFSALYQIADGLFVGRFIGEDALAAVNLIMPIIMMVFAFSSMIATGASVRISVLLGEKNREEASRVFTYSLKFIFVMSCIIGALGLIFAEPFVRLLAPGATDGAIEYGITYTRVYALFSPLMPIYHATDNYLRVCGKEKLSMWLSVGTQILNIVLDVILIAFLGQGVWAAAFTSCIAISETESQKRKEFLRFQREHCNELWQTDFKGDFLLLDGTRCFPLDIIDDCSRFCLCIDAKEKAGGIIPSFEAVFKQYGLPKAILSDNGGAFAGFKGGYTLFERWLMDLDVLPIHGRPLHPQTQGKIERFHRTMKNELLKRNAILDLADADKHLKEWRAKYNEIRPHEAIDMRCPADIYIPSERKYPDTIKSYEYSGFHRVLKVNFKGYLRFDSKVFYLSESMVGAELELRLEGADFASLCYRNYKIAEIDLRTEQLLNRRISRLD